MVYVIVNGLYDVVLGFRILGKGVLEGGMLFIKYVVN